MTIAFRRTAERRNKMVLWPLSPTEKSAKLTPFRVIAPLYEKFTVYLAKKLTFAPPGPTAEVRTDTRVRRRLRAPTAAWSAHVVSGIACHAVASRSAAAIP